MCTGRAKSPPSASSPKSCHPTADVLRAGQRALGAPMSGARVVRVTIGTRNVLLILHSGPAATLKSLEPAQPLKHAPPPPLYGELRGWKRGAEPEGNNEMSVHTRSYYNKERNYESGRYTCAHLVPLLLSAPSHAPPNLPHLRHLGRGRINRFGRTG